MEREGYGGGFRSPISDGERKAALTVGRNRRKEKGKGRRSLTGGTGSSAARVRDAAARAKTGRLAVAWTRPRNRRRAQGKGGPRTGRQAEADAGKSGGPRALGCGRSGPNSE
jgi:hypothetical protein